MTAQVKKKSLLDAPIFDSRIKSANTTKAESWLGYFTGPALMFIVYICLGGSYLNQFYTDVLGLSGVFLTWMPAISKAVDAFHRAEAEARGEVYVSPEEKARLEQEENDRIAEENRLKELKAKCEKKGLNFEEEEARYQAKLAEKKAKAEAKAAKRK